MGLKDLMEASGVEESEKQSSPTENKKTSSSPTKETSGGSARLGKSVEFTPPDSHISYDDDAKACPNCITVCERTGKREYTCTNENCGTVNFTAGWNERGDGEGFLQGVDWAEVEEELQDILRFR